MNRTNRSIAALFILTTLAVQPVATHAMAGRVAQAAKQGFNAAKQFASARNLKTAAKTTALLSPVGYVIADPLHGGSKLDEKTGTYTADKTMFLPRAVVIGSLATTYTVAVKAVGGIADMAAQMCCGARVELPSTKSIFLIGATVSAGVLYARGDSHKDKNQRMFLRNNANLYMYPSKPGLSWDRLRRLHDQCVAHKDSSRK